MNSFRQNPHGCPIIRWLDKGEEDLKKLNVEHCKDLVNYRDRWRNIIADEPLREQAPAPKEEKKRRLIRNICN